MHYLLNTITQTKIGDLMKFTYTNTRPVWLNEAYFSAVHEARLKITNGQDWDLYKDRLMYRALTRDKDTGEDFAYKCKDLIDYGHLTKVHDWEASVERWLTKETGFGVEQGKQAMDIYWAVKTLGHKWGSDGYSRAVHGVHTSWLDLATKFKLDVQWKRNLTFKDFFNE